MKRRTKEETLAEFVEGRSLGNINPKGKRMEKDKLKVGGQGSPHIHPKSGSKCQMDVRREETSGHQLTKLSKGQQNPNNYTKTKLERIAWLSSKDPQKEYGCLMHLYNEESLTECFHELDGKKAVGLDGINKNRYGEDLTGNIGDLIKRMKKMAYRPGNIRKVEIPKEGKPGAFRPLGISNFEDKIIQSMTSKILISIYDPIFRDSSFGFRPGKSCHDAVKALYQHLSSKEVAVVIDIDLENFFGTIDHKILEDLMRDKIKDPKFMRYIVRMFKAGILSNGELKVSEEGVPQGSVCSPTMSNIYAHYALDTWIEDTVNPQSQGEIQLFRYADDSVICCEREEDAKALLEALELRLAEFKLRLNVEKTEIVSFSKRKARKGIRQGVQTIPLCLSGQI